MSGQYQIVPQIDQPILPDETANVVFIAFTKHLFVHPGALLPIGEVVAAGRAAPTNVQRQLHYAGDLLYGLCTHVRVEIRGRTTRKTGSRFQAPGPWHLAPGTWPLAPGPWPLAPV